MGKDGGLKPEAQKPGVDASSATTKEKQETGGQKEEGRSEQLDPTVEKSSGAVAGKP